jgi:hypothetical protein
MEELDLVVLTHDIPERGLQRGDLGTIVHRYTDGQAWGVTKATLLGKRLCQSEYKPIGGVWEGIPHFCQSTSPVRWDQTVPPSGAGQRNNAPRSRQRL